jgi:hypothetical protein
MLVLAVAVFIAPVIAAPKVAPEKQLQSAAQPSTKHPTYGFEYDPHNCFSTREPQGVSAC